MSNVEDRLKDLFSQLNEAARGHNVDDVLSLTQNLEDTFTDFTQASPSQPSASSRPSVWERSPQSRQAPPLQGASQHNRGE